MTDADWVRTPWCKELTSWKLGIGDNCGDALASDTNRMSAPLSFDHRFCAKQELKFVCIISDSRCIEKSRWWKRLKSGQAETKLLEKKDNISSSSDLTPNYQIIQGLMSYSFYVCHTLFPFFKGGDEFLPFRHLLFFLFVCWYLFVVVCLFCFIFFLFLKKSGYCLLIELFIVLTALTIIFVTTA